jgi:hypothetical protein
MAKRSKKLEDINFGVKGQPFEVTKKQKIATATAALAQIKKFSERVSKMRAELKGKRETEVDNTVEMKVAITTVPASIKLSVSMPVTCRYHRN